MGQPRILLWSWSNQCKALGGPQKVCFHKSLNVFKTMFTLWSLLKIIHHHRDSQRGAFLSRGVLRPAGKVDQAWQQDLDKWVHHLLSPFKLNLASPRFLEAFDMTAEMQFLPDLLQSGERLTHVLDLENDWQSKVEIQNQGSDQRFFRRVGSDPYPKAVLCLLLYQDKSPWILICPDYSILFCPFALTF